MASSVDVLFVVGYNHSDEGELFQLEMEGEMAGMGGDRIHSLGLLPKNQACERSRPRHKFRSSVDRR